MVAKRGFDSMRSILKATGDSGLKAASASVSTTLTMRFSRFISMVVKGRPSWRTGPRAALAAEHGVSTE